MTLLVEEMQFEEFEAGLEQQSHLEGESIQVFS